jgi:hypothetical protein
MVGGLTAGATLAMSGIAHADTFTVALTTDTATATDCDLPTNTDCSLRDAITDANGNAGADTIHFKSGLTGTITLTSDLPTITDPVTISGPGASTLTLNGDDAYRIFDVLTVTDGDPVSISGLTLTGGNTASSTHPRDGGAILDENADLTVADSVITGNTANELGGGIYTGCADFVCGIGLSGYSAYLTLDGSTVSGNTATSGNGGGMYLNYGGATITNSTISGNHASNGGAGLSIFYMQSPVVIENSTIANNQATNPSNTFGGGIFLFGNTGGLSLSNSTVAGNKAIQGGGIYDESASSPPAEDPPVLHNSIIAGNTAAVGSSDLFNASSSSFESAFSLIGTTAHAAIHETVAGSDITGVNPMLGPLAANGGPTKTQAPLAGSPAIDKGSRFGQTKDQRSLTRPIDLPDYLNSTAAGADGSDIGAVELQSSPGGGDVVTPPAPTPPTQHKKKCKKKKKAKKGASAAKKKNCKKKKKK